MAVKDTDRGWANLERLMEVGRYEVTVTAPPFYAVFLEFGTRLMEARPFMAWTWDQHGNYEKSTAKFAHTLFSARSLTAQGAVGAVVTGLTELAEKVVRDTRQMIIGMGLIRTGRLLRSISYEIAGNGRAWLGGTPDLGKKLPIRYAVGGAS